ncbi:MAG: hypothetical protein U0805_02410 [Pirellulales bacterium]
MDRAEVHALAKAFKGKLCWWRRIDAKPFCDFLISSNRLTAWQCNKLLVGKWKGFYLDHFVLLDQIGKDSDYSYYKARNTTDGKMVRLSITPVNRTNGRIEYRVEPFIEQSCEDS